MIPELKKQTGDTVMKFFHNQLKKSSSFCREMTHFFPLTGHYRVFTFSTGSETLLVLVDYQPEQRSEYADERGLKMRIPSYYREENISRQSPAYIIAQLIDLYIQAFADKFLETPTVWGVLLTSSKIVNYKELYGVWNIMNLSVFHQLQGLNHPNFLPSKDIPEQINQQNLIFWNWCRKQFDHSEDKEKAVESFRKEETEEEGYIFPSIFDELDDNLNEDDYDDIDEVESMAQLVLSQNNTVKVEILNPISNPHEELKKLVGCDQIKSQINDLVQLSKYNYWMHQYYPEWKQHKLSLHAIFFGRPGTGKTTVCKIYGALLKETGVLSKGHVVVCNRSTFIGSNWGDEEKAIRQVLELAKGGVLMIDEAYLLNSENKNDPGKLVIPMLMDVLANEDQRDIAIVLCGYKEPMQKLLDLNPGLASRFPNRYEFRDFSINELLEITRRRINEYNYRFTRAAWAKYRRLLSAFFADRDPQTWGNARFVANLLEHIYLLHAKRCMKHQHIQTTTSLFCITSSDIQPIDIPKENKKIGFI